MDADRFIDRVFLADNMELMISMPPEFLDLVYIDPPFRTQKDFDSFDDRWKSMGEYINFIKSRMTQIRRILKKNGSVYVHCDHRASHYIKVMLDDVFGIENFINEIIWCFRGGGRGRYFARKHESIFLYVKGKDYTFNDEHARIPYSESYGGGAYYYSKKKTAMPRSLKCGINAWNPDDRGKVMEDYWIDIPVLGSQSKSRNGYPTQKPEELLERIVLVSSNEGDVVADFFCGSGTTLVVAKKNRRRYVGCDVGREAVEISRNRLNDVHVVETL